MWTKPRRRTKHRLSAAVLLALASLASCDSQTTEPTGGETHFLRGCDPDANDCGSGLTCLCHICTLPCSEQTACGDLPGGECSPSTASAACGTTMTGGYCEARCTSDSDCRDLSDQHRCERGACRIGTTVDPAAECAHGQTAANDVLVIGDSFFALQHQVAAFLEDRARTAGALRPGERYRDNSSLAANALALTGNGIEGQYAAGVSDAPVKVVVMTGGGADALIGSCPSPPTDCTVLTDAAAAARSLLARMASDGVEHVLYVFYPDALEPELRAKVDALRPLVQAECASSAVPCHFIDLRSTFAGRYDEYIIPDGMNPTSEGSQATADVIWATMQEECIAQ
jgi:hypothetical protein